jgi:hypothetical protein
MIWPTFILLLRRYSTSGWGFMIPSKIAWVVSTSLPLFRQQYVYRLPHASASPFLADPRCSTYSFASHLHINRPRRSLVSRSPPSGWPY